MGQTDKGMSLQPDASLFAKRVGPYERPSRIIRVVSSKPCLRKEDVLARQLANDLSQDNFVNR